MLSGQQKGEEGGEPREEELAGALLLLLLPQAQTPGAELQHNKSSAEKILLFNHLMRRKNAADTVSEEEPLTTVTAREHRGWFANPKSVPEAGSRSTAETFKSDSEDLSDCEGVTS